MRAPGIADGSEASGPVGSLAWARATSGNLSPSERRSLLAPILRTTGQYLVGRLCLALGLRPRDAADLELESFELPDSKLVREAEQACRDELSPAMVNHSYRTFLFGLALARFDGTAVDAEHLYVSSLLHDIALESPDAASCFAVAGARRMLDLAVRAGADEATAARLAEAICLHISPGLGSERDPLGPTITAGALADLTGLRLWQLAPEFVREAIRRYPRHDCKRHLATCWKREAAVFRGGRAAALERYARFSLLVRLAPFAE